MSGKSGKVLAAAAALLTLAAAALYARADRVLDLLEAKAAGAEAGLGGRLRAAGVLAYWDFDAPRPRERISRSGGPNDGTRLVAGRSGQARSFLPDEHGLIRTGVPLAALGDRFTFSAWLRFPAQIRDQQIFQYLAVRDATLVLRLPGQAELKGPPAPTGDFFHVAFTVDAQEGRAVLFVAGATAGAQALRPLHHPAQPIAFGQERYAPPPSFTLDEVSVWNRPLSPAEVARLARLRFSLAADKALPGLAKVGLATSALDSFRALLLAADLFNPFLHESRIGAAHLTTYALAMSRSDVRQFNKYFNEVRENGLTAPRSSQRRRVDLAGGGRASTAAMELLAGNQVDPVESSKRTFTLEILDEGGEPERTVLVRPTEGTPYLLEVLAGRLARACAIPAATPELCTVSVNGTFEGIHLCSELVREQGPFWLGTPGAWQGLVRRAPVFRDEALREFDELVLAYEGALTSDRKSPLTSREIRREIRRQRRLLAEAFPDRSPRTDEALVTRVADSLGEDLFLGGNPHARLVVGDLDFSVRAINGAKISFSSLTPAVLGDDGRVTPPALGSAEALLRVTVRSGAAARTKDLKFTVLAVPRRLPILGVQSAGEPSAVGTVAALARFFDGEGRRGPLLGGQVRLRGNTSLYRKQNQKKYYRVTLDRPHEIPGVGHTRRLLLTSEWRDVTLLRERLAYDLFRAFSAPGAPRYAPHVQPVELVVNGDYKGVYNLTDRVDADLLGFGKEGGGADRAVLYKAMTTGANFKTPVREAYIQEVPEWRDGEFWGPFDALIGFIGNSTPEDFGARVERIVDVDNIVDFEILLKLTSNFEGVAYNLYLARREGSDARFFIVPWDYDMTFHHQAIPSNFLIDRLHRGLPGYGRRVLERWRSLRGGLLSEKALGERLDRQASELADAAERNYRRWPNTPGETWQGKLGELRTFIGVHLRRLDAHFAAAAGSP